MPKSDIKPFIAGKGSSGQARAVICMSGNGSNAEKLLDNAEKEGGIIANATVIVDPPRKGLEEELIRYLAKREMDRIVYVSCDPDTLARDCALFKELGYTIGRVTPVDMFPRTGHVESVVSLRRE